MAQHILLNHLQNLSPETTQKLLLLELLHTTIESKKAHLPIASRLLSLDPTIQIHSRSPDTLALFLAKLVSKAKEILSEKPEPSADTVWEAAHTLLNATLPNQADAAIQFARAYYSSYLDRISKS